MQLSGTERFVLLGMIAEGIGSAIAIGRVELADPEKRGALRHSDYGPLAVGIMTASILGAVALALEPPEERPRR